MEAFNDRLLTSICYATSHVCVGLDPDPSLITPELRSAATRALRKSPFARTAVIGDDLNASPAQELTSVCEAVALLTQNVAAAYKPNAAFFEGSRTGLAALEGLRRFLGQLSPNAISICDAKRGDIGNTSARYADAVFNRWKYDAITINPLMGTDSVEPFLREPLHGAFLLCLTSNPGASDFLLKGDLYKRIAEQAVRWNTNNNVGLVVGATRAEHAAAVRAIAPELPLLIPGVGAQGGSLSEILDAIDGPNNPRFIINASRSIMYPKPAADTDYASAVTSAAEQLRDEINTHLKKS